VLDQSESMVIWADPEFPSMLRALRETVADPLVIPHLGQQNPGGGTRALAVQMNAIVHTTREVLEQGAQVVMPWTVMDATTAPLFARRLGATHSRVHPADPPSNRVGAGFRAAAASLARSGIDPQTTPTSASILLIGNERPGDDADIARVEATAPGKFDRISALGSGDALRDDMLRDVTMPRPGTPDPTALEIDLYSTGFASDVSNMHPEPLPPHAWPFRDALRLMLTRLSWCASDYDRNEAHQQSDLTLLSAHSAQCALNPPPHPSCNPYADWNFDGIFDGHLPGGIDRQKLELHLPAPCP